MKFYHIGKILPVKFTFPKNPFFSKFPAILVVSKFSTHVKRLTPVILPIRSKF